MPRIAQLAGRFNQVPTGGAQHRCPFPRLADTRTHGGFAAADPGPHQLLQGLFLAATRQLLTEVQSGLGTLQPDRPLRRCRWQFRATLGQPAQSQLAGIVPAGRHRRPGFFLQLIPQPGDSPRRQTHRLPIAGQAKDCPGPALRLQPQSLGGQAETLQHAVIGEVFQTLCRHRHPMAHDDPVGLVGKQPDDQVLRVGIQPHLFWLIHPAAQLAHPRGDARCDLPLKLAPPVITLHKHVAVHVHVAQLQRVGDVVQQLAVTLLDGLPPIGPLGGGLDQFVHLADYRRLHIGEEIGGGRELELHRLVQQRQQRPAQIGGARHPQLKARVQRLEVVRRLQQGHRIEHARIRLAQAIGRQQMPTDALLEVVPLPLQLLPGHQPVLHRQMRGQALELVAAGQNVAQPHQRAQLLQGLHPQKRRHPAQGARATLMLVEELPHHPLVFIGGVALLIEGEIDDHLPVWLAVLQRTGRQLANVAKQQGCLPRGVPVPERMGQLLLTLLPHIQPLDQQGPHQPQAVAVVVLILHLVENALRVDPRDADADAGIGPLLHRDLRHLGRPGPHPGQRHLRLPTRDGRADAAIVQRHQPLGGEVFQHPHLGHQGRQQQRFHQPVIGHKTAAPGVTLGQEQRLLAPDGMILLQHG